jgi:formate dehydrogenase major subunit
MKTEKYPRLEKPLVRDGDRKTGRLREASWEEALARAASGLAQAKTLQGPQSIGFFSCSKSTNEVNFAAQKLARSVIGTNNIDSCNRT